MCRPLTAPCFSLSRTDAFIELLYPPAPIPDITVDPKDGIPSGRSIALLAAGFPDAKSTAGM